MLTDQESKQPVIDIGNDDDPTAVTAMLRFFYDGSYLLDKSGDNTADQHLTMYRLADLYDASDLRKAASRHLIGHFREDRYNWGSPDPYRMADQIIRTIQQIIGPNADTFADNSIQEDVFKFIFEEASSLYKNELFQELLSDGSMFGESFTRRFLLKTGELITRLKSRNSRSEVSLVRCMPSNLVIYQHEESIY